MLQLLEEIRQEFSIDEDGKAFASRRAIARLADVDEKSVRLLLEKIAAEQKVPENLESFTGQSFDSAALIPDLLASAIIEYYAYEAGRHCTKQAKQVCRVFRAVGFRSWVQDELGWKKPEKPLTPAEMLLGMAQQLVDQERRLLKSESQLTELLANKADAEADLKSLPISLEIAPVRSARANLNEIVRNYTQRTNAHYPDIWDRLYRELYYRCHYDAKARAKHRNRKPLDCVEADGLMDGLWAIASEILK